MKQFIFLSVFTIIFTTLSGQNYRPYKDGALAYNDFKGHPLELDNQSGMIYFDFDFAEDVKIIDGIKFPHNRIEVLVNTEQSWLDFDKTPDRNIDYFQILFDIEHLYAEKYNALIINNLMNNKDKEAADLLNEKQITLDKYKLESQNGSKLHINQKWRERIAQEIQSISISVPTANLISRNGFDAHLGIGYNLLGGDLNTYYGNALGLAFGFNLNIKNYYIVFSGSLGVANTDEQHTDFLGWEKGIHRNDAVWNFGLGRKFDLGKAYLSPFIGPSLINVFVNKTDFEDVYPETSDTKWKIGGGIMLDLPFSKLFSNPNAYNVYNTPGTRNIFTNHGIRLSFHYVPKVNLFEAYNGDAKSIALSYYFYMGDLKIVEN